MRGALGWSGTQRLYFFSNLRPVSYWFVTLESPIDAFRFSDYDKQVIRSFGNKHTERLFARKRVPKFQSIEQVAWRKLQHIEAAVSLDDLGAIPGNQLEKLVGDRKEQYSIRINAQYRICFIWTDDGPRGVEIVDYH